MEFEMIPVMEFLARRKASIAYTKAQFGDSVIICDPEDDIVCDVCNADAFEQFVWISKDMLYCKSCREKK